MGEGSQQRALHGTPAASWQPLTMPYDSGCCALCLLADEAFEVLLEVTGAAGAEDMAAGAPGVNVQHSGGWVACHSWARRQQLCVECSRQVCMGLFCLLAACLGDSHLGASPVAQHPAGCLPLLGPAAKGATPLMAAAVHGRDDVVSTLLSNGVSCLRFEEPLRKYCANLEGLGGCAAHSAVQRGG